MASSGCRKTPAAMCRRVTSEREPRESEELIVQPEGPERHYVAVSVFNVIAQLANQTCLFKVDEIIRDVIVR